MLNNRENQRTPKINPYVDYRRAFEEQIKLLNVLRRMEIPEHLIVLIQNIGYKIQDKKPQPRPNMAKQTGSRLLVRQGCIFLPYLFNRIYSILKQAGWEENGFKIAGRKLLEN